MREQDMSKAQLHAELQALRARLQEAETRCQRAEKELRNSESRFQAFINHSPIVAFMKDLEGRLVYLSEGYRDVFGAAPAKALGKTAFDLFPAEVAQQCRAADMQALHSSRPHEVIEEVPTADGSLRQLLVFKFPFQDTGGSRYLGGVAVDVTERRRAEEALRESESRFRQIAETVEAVLWMTNAEHTELLYVNPAYERIVGRTVASLYAHPESWLEAVHPEDRPRVLAAQEEFLGTGRYRVEFRIVRPDGTVRWIVDHGFPVFDEEGRLYRRAGFAKDVTEHRQMEQRLRRSEKMQAVGWLAGGVAHHFNNLLTIILGFSEVLLEAAVSGSVERQGLDQIRRAAERAAALARQLLAYGRRQLLAPRRIELNATLARLAKVVRPLLGPGIELVVTPGPTPVAVQVDPGYLEEAVRHLVQNACDAMPQGGRLTLTAGEIEVPADGTGPVECRPGRYAVLTVADTGAGMAPEALAHLFEPFFTTRESTERLGLGLATVYGFVKQSGGEVEVLSSAGAGTTVHVYLPRLHETGAEPLSEPAEPTRETILVVEEEDAVRELIRMVLAQEGYQVVEASSSQAAVAAAAAHVGPLPLLATEIDLHHLRGPELAEHLAQARPGLKVLFLCGHDVDDSLREKVLHGQAAVLWKPFTPTALLQKVRGLLGS